MSKETCSPENPCASCRGILSVFTTNEASQKKHDIDASVDNAHKSGGPDQHVWGLNAEGEKK